MAQQLWIPTLTSVCTPSPNVFHSYVSNCIMYLLAHTLLISKPHVNPSLTTDMADPDSHKKDFQKQLQYQASKRKNTLDPLTDSNYQHALEKMAFLRRESCPLIPSRAGHPSSSSVKQTHVHTHTSAQAYVFTSSYAVNRDGEEVDDSDATITFLQLVRVPLDKSMCNPSYCQNPLDVHICALLANCIHAQAVFLC